MLTTEIILTSNKKVWKIVFSLKKKDQSIKLSGTFSKSRESDGDPQLRRPEQQYGIKYSNKFKKSFQTIYI